MYAIAFDLEIAALKKEYGDPYNKAYAEIRDELSKFDFEWTQGSLYLDKAENGLSNVMLAVNRLSEIEWFRKSVRDIRAFRVEDWSDIKHVVTRERG